MHSLTRRIRRPELKPPVLDPSGLEEARAAARKAEEDLSQALSRTPAVEEHAARAERIHRENNLGPRFWAAVESMTGGRA